ncbi:MAG: helix-turn-helix domain-containing protein [Clostridia bacterium]|nr:helix-turn-helix domain-containing protein [Clostridia bacterium]
MDRHQNGYLKQRRQELGLTQNDVATHVGVSEATVSRWESGDIANMRQGRIAALAEILRIDPSVIVGMAEGSVSAALADKERTLPANILPLPKVRPLPLVGAIACGTPILAAENIEEYLQIPENVPADFCLKCKGDSMINARIFDGDIVLIHEQPDVDNGEIAAVLIGEEATLKRVYKYPNRMELRAENPLFPPLNFEGADLSRIRILGKAVAFLSIVR